MMMTHDGLDNMYGQTIIGIEHYPDDSNRFDSPLHIFCFSAF
eukprot:SAG31_NODE_225_length_19846_cov_19.057983_28_plen_42_part_00